MRRILPAREYSEWLRRFLPTIPTRAQAAPWLAPGVVTDRSDPKLAHIDGLNLSRSWMLLGIAAGLPQGDRRVAALRAAAETHAAAALPAVTGEHYAGGHWLGTFAVYLTTARRTRDQSPPPRPALAEGLAPWNAPSASTRSRTCCAAAAS